MVCTLPGFYWLHFYSSANLYHFVDHLDGAWEGKCGLFLRNVTELKKEYAETNKSEMQSSRLNQSAKLMPELSLSIFKRNTTSLFLSQKERIESKQSEPLLTLFTSWEESNSKYLVHSLS